MVHQHFQLVPVFDVVEAVALGAESVTGPLGTFDRGRRASASSSSRAVRPPRRPRRDIEDLPVGVRQRVEILKALYRKSDVLVLDEPSARPDAVGDRGAVRDHPRARRSRHDHHLHHAQAQRGPRGLRPHHGPAPRSSGRHRRARNDDPRAAREPHGRSRRGAARRQGPGEPGRRGAQPARHRRPRRPRSHRGQGRLARCPGRRDRRDRRGPGQRPDGARRGHRRPADRRLRRRSTVAGTDITKASPRQVSDLGVAHIPEDRAATG